MHGLREEGMRKQPRKVGGINATDLPKFVGGFDTKGYLEWEEKIERILSSKG